ncbi:MAG: ATP-binding protein [Lachnospiraceae bacterium]|nr:ATP-binding protein [Lachnospiraceae bacterium]MDU7685927.1 ATP-binding protein [Bacillota bacterium]
MDKYEYRVKTEQMLEYMGEKSYKKAAEIADSIDWRKVKNAAMLCGASEVYEYNGEYEKSREILFLAYDRAPGSRKIVYRLGTLALKMNDIRESVDCYEEFVAMAPKDPNQYILRYKILKSQKAPLNQQIEALEDFKKAEYVEKWAYELAKLYDAAGMLTECLEECDDLILWFSEGKYVYQAMELKMKYKPLTPLQQEKYIHRNDKPTPAKRKKEPIAEKSEEIAEKKEYVEEEKKAEPFEEEEQEVTSEPKEEKEALEMKEAEEVALEEKEEPKEEEAVLEEEEEPKEEEAVLEEEEEPKEEEAVLKEEEEPEEGEDALEMKEELREEELILEAEEGTKKEKCTSEIEKEPEEKGTVSETKEESEEKETSSSEEEIDEQMKKEIFSQTTKMSVEEILQNWEEKQKENAQIIQEEQEKARAERERQEAKKVEEVESILPDDIRQLMEELEAEAVEIRTNKNRRERTEQVFERKSEIESVEEIPQEQEEEMEEPEEDPFDEESFNEEAFEEVEADGFEEIEEIEEIEESEGIKLGDTQAIAISAKALMNDTVVEEPIEKVQELRTESPTSPFDTGFIVQGRYDLDVQSEIGIKAGLTEEQKKLFSYFVPVHGMSEQIVDVLENDKKCKTRYGTSRTANLLVVGRKGSGKTVLAVDIVKAIQKNRKLKQGKVAIVTAESLNKKDVSQIIEKLHGGAIIIERASQMNKKTVAQLNDLMEEQTGELLVVLEEERRPLDKMLSAYPAFKKKFTSRLELPVFTNDELVTFGQTYAKENGYKIDEMGILALYSRIDLMQREESVVTVADVKEIVDEAIEHSQRKNFKRFIKKLFKKGKEETSRIILQEQDFR